MATNAGEMWIEMGIKDNVTDGITRMSKDFERFDNIVRKVVAELKVFEAMGGEDMEGFTKQTISQAKEYYDLVAKITQAERDLSSVIKERNSRKMNTEVETGYKDTLAKLRNQLRNNVPLGDEDFTKAFRISLGNTLNELKGYMHSAREEMKQFDKDDEKKLKVRKEITEEAGRLEVIEERISRMRDDAKSKAAIADIKEQTVEYNALLEKVKGYEDLLKRIDRERKKVHRSSTATKSSMTDAVVTKELDAIQQKYNEDVALGAQLAKKDAEAKKLQEEETLKLTNKLKENERIQKALTKSLNDAESQRRIAQIRGLKSEYDALGQKIIQISSLLQRVSDEQAKIQNDPKYTPALTKETITEELDRIQRRYNEDLARGKELERQDAEAKAKATQSSRELANANRSLMNSYDKVTNSGKQTMNTLSMLRQQAGYYFSLFGAQTLLRNIIAVGGQFEYQRVALQNIIGDAERAVSIFAQLKDLAVDSPKTFMELTASAKQLSAYQIPVEELYETTKRLSDLSVGLGVDVNRLILAYGQVRSAAVLRGQELRQFTEAGIPLVQALADKFTEMNGKMTTTADVFKLISQRAVSFEMVKEVMWDMTNQGGQFYNMQEEMSETLYGKWQKLADIWQITLGDMANTEFLWIKPFHALVDVLVFAARNLTNLMPVLSGIFTAKAFGFVKDKTFNMFTSNGIEKNVVQAQKLQAIELRRSYVNGEITKKMYQQRLALNANKDNYYMLLAAEGKISDFQIRRLIQEKKITTEKIRQGLANGTLLEQEAVQLRLIMQQNAQGKLGATNMVGNMGKNLLSFMGGWVGVALAAFGAIWSIYQNYRDRVEADEARTKERMQAAQEAWKKADIALNDVKSSSKTEESITKMKDWLKENADSWDLVSRSMENNDGTAKTLSERYEILKKAIEGVRNANEKASDGRNIFGDAGKSENVADHLEDAQKRLNDFKETSSRVLSTYYSNIKKGMDVVIARNEEFRKAVSAEGAENSLQKQMELIMRYPAAWRQLWDAVAHDGNMYSVLNNIDQSWGRYAREMKKAEKDLPKFGESIKTEMRKRWDDINFKNLTSEQKEYLISMYKKWLEEHNITSTEVLRDMDEKFLNKQYHIRLIYTTEKSENLNQLQSDALGYLGGNTTAPEQKKAAVTRWTQSGSLYTARNMAKNEIDEAYNEWKSIEKTIDNLKKQGTKVTAQTESLRRSAKENYEALVSAAWEGIGMDYKGSDQKSNKTPKKTEPKTDKFAKDMSERVSVLKEAYSEYKKWKAVIGKDAAIEKVKGSGIFSTLFSDKDFAGIENYRKELERIKESLDTGKIEQRKVAQTIDKILFGMDYDEQKEAADKGIAIMKSSMTEIVKQWGDYKAIFEKTGDKSLADLVFTGGMKWDDKAKAMASELEKNVGKGAISYDMSDSEAKEFFDYNTERGKALYEQWKSIVDLLKGNFVNALNEVATAQEKLLDTQEKIAKVEQDIAELRRKGAQNNDPRIILKQKELNQLVKNAFEESTPYLSFYSAIFSMTRDEAEKIGDAIKANLVKQLAEGTINADKYLKSTKNIDAQLEKIRKKQSSFAAFATGGLNDLFQNTYNNAEGAYNKAAIEMQKASDDFTKAHEKGDVSAMMQATASKATAQNMMKGAESAMEGAESAMMTVATIDKIVHGINDTVQGIKGSFDEIREMYDALGYDTESDSWEDWNTFLEGFSKASQNATNAWDSLKNGNVGGVIQGIIGSYTAWVTAFAKGHDKKLDNAIKKSIRRVKELENAYKNLETEIDRALGGIYTAGGYDEMFKNYKDQLDELEKQRKAENDKKKKDQDKLLDYDQQIKEMKDTIKYFAEDMAKELYSIDVKSWAQSLTDAVVDAWAKGEDAVQAWHDKVRELVNDITKNILAQKVVEVALRPVLDYVTDQMTAKNGRLDENDVVRVAKLLDEAGESSVSTITTILDAMKKAGYDLTDAESSKSGNLSSSISSITEDAGDLLVSYVNAIRADVSVNREQLAQIVLMMEQMPSMNATAQAQLRQLETISANTGRNADSNDEILSVLRGWIVSGIYTPKIK